MRKFTSIIVATVATAATVLFQGAAWADFVRVSNNVYTNLAAVEQNRDENLRLHRAAPGFISIRFYSNAQTGEGGSVSLWETREQAEAFYSGDAYRSFASQNVSPHVGERRVNAIYEVTLDSDQ